MTKVNTDGGAMVRMDFKKKGRVVTLEDCGYSLVWVSRPQISGHKNFRIYPVHVPDSMLNATERAKRNLFYNNKSNIKPPFWGGFFNVLLASSRPIRSRQ